MFFFFSFFLSLNQCHQLPIRANSNRRSIGEDDLRCREINSIISLNYQSPMQTEKFQPEGKWIMPSMRFNEFPALSNDPRVGISRSPPRLVIDYFSYLKLASNGSTLLLS